MANEVGEYIAARKIAEEEAEATAALGFVPCGTPHGDAQTRYTFGPRTGEIDVAPAFDGPCPECGACL